MDDKHQTNSAGSSCESPPFDELSHRRSRTGSNFSSSGDSGGSANGLMTTGHGGNHNVTLRTASRKPKSQPTASINASTSTVTGTKENGNPKTDSPTSELPGAAASSLSPDGDSGNTDGLITEEHRARQNHNIVEKQYRNRLNSQFERLLSILPANQMEGADTGKSVDFDERRMSKAEVLDLARRRIHALESEIKQLYADRDNLRNNVATLNLAIRNGQRPQQQQPQQQQRLSIAI
ncbi:hypothetical protein HMPREF1624_02306 [Sporothrix schenckii ATCC 58251]|uniref:BHLH domain-containing protein n=2 Tax=Sporothrix schenckii TaxID=29908 RepID=U7PZJ9_SPOS1|nr:hypothetical protein HMPREF1624_02306 [Sporothrix schenckii ATCC 58251]